MRYRYRVLVLLVLLAVIVYLDRVLMASVFNVFSSFGVMWAAVWYWYYQGTPSDMPGVPRLEIEEVGSAPPQRHEPLPWGVALHSTNLWCIMLMGFHADMPDRAAPSRYTAFCRRHCGYGGSR